MSNLDLASLFNCDQVPHEYAVIVLNQIISTDHFQFLYNRASWKVCADGGYDKLRSWADKSGLNFSEYFPDYIIGDLDSISDGIDNGKSEIIRIIDQDRNDLQKCIDFIRSATSSMTFVVIGALGGRFDHEIQSLNVLYSYPDSTIIYLNEQSLLTLLASGETVINVCNSFLGPHCGFGPLKDSSRVSTSGFRWNLQDQRTSFYHASYNRSTCFIGVGLGELVSSSNIVDSTTLILNNDMPILFTIELRPRS